MILSTIRKTRCCILAKNIIIETDGVAHQYSGVKEIRTENPQGSDDRWVPVDEIATAVKTVNKNGTYEAEKDGYFGYTKVVVKSKGVTTGTKPDNRLYSVALTDDNYITEMVLADSIAVQTPPNKVSYQNGEAIDLTGLVVKASSKTELWAMLAAISGRLPEQYGNNVIPISELEISPAIADIANGTNQTISVMWERYDDFEPLYTEFYITVSE